MVPVYIWHKHKKGGLFRKTYIIIGEKIPFESFEYDKEETGVYNRMTSLIFDRVCALGESFEADMEAKKK